MKKFYLGIEDRYGMDGKMVSSTQLLVVRSSDDSMKAIFEKMFIVSKYGNFDVEFEFRFDSTSKFLVINKADGQTMGEGVCYGSYENPISMVDTILIQQTKEKAVAVFSFEGSRIFVGKTYFSLESGEQVGFSIEKCYEIDREKYDAFKSRPETMINALSKFQI